MHPVLRVYLVRHGETNENRMGIIQGQLDTELNEDGVKQSERLAHAFKEIQFSAAYCSDLKRTVKTAEIVLEKHQYVTLVKEAALRERFMGELQGVKVGTYNKSKLPQSVELGYKFSLRTLTWWNEMLSHHLPSAQTASETKHVLAVSHGAYIATLCRALVSQNIITLPEHLSFTPCYNTSVTIIDVSPSGSGVFVKYSDISHLLMPVLQKNVDEQLEAQTDK